MSSEQDPAYWRSLYKAPTESEEDVEATGFHVIIEASDLIAERDGASEAEGSSSDSSNGANIDPAQMAAMLDKMLKKRLAAMARQGMLSAPVAESRPRRGSAGAQASTSAAPSAATMSALSPEDLKPPEPASASADVSADEAEPWESDRSSMTIDDDLAPWEEAAEEVPMEADTQASTVTIEGAEEFGIEEAEEFSIEVDEEDDDDDEEELFVAIEDDEEDDDEDFEIEVEDDEPAVAAATEAGDPWSRVPILPGGQSSLMAVDGLSAAAPMVLVLIDGVSTLKGLKMLVPHVPDEDFTAIIEDGVARGLVVFD